jgi:outer membrane immunogenic protein
MADGPRGSLKDSRSYDRPFSWTGFYVGGSIGAGQLESDHLVSLDGLGFLNPPNASVRDTNFLGGVVLGYDWPVGNFVYGVAVDLSAGNLQGLTIQEGDDGFETRIKSFGTARLKLGYSMGRALAYVTGGLAFGRVDATVGDLDFNPGPFFSPDLHATGSRTHFGWTVSGGMDFAVTNNLIVGIEYLFVDLGTKTYDVIDTTGSNTIFDVDAQMHVGRANIKWKF